MSVRFICPEHANNNPLIGCLLFICTCSGDLSQDTGMKHLLCGVFFLFNASI
jgi:hypothetical protein